MPGLILFSRRWAIGSDDFVFSSFGEALLRIAWLIALVIILAVHTHGFNCEHGTQLKAFYIGTLVLDSLAIINLFIILRISMQGTIANAWPRRNLSKWLYVKLLIMFPETIWVCISSYWAFGHSYQCEWSVVWTARGAVICSWIVGFIMFVGILISFDPLGSLNERRESTRSLSQASDIGSSVGSSTKVWETRCRVMCCCIAYNPDTRQAFLDVSRVVAEFFRDLDLVATDIAAGLVLVQQQQVDTESQFNSVLISGYNNQGISAQAAPADDGLPEPKIWMTIPNMVRYMEFAMGSYGWPFYIYENLATGVCRLCPQYRFCACVRKSNGVISDNICQCNTATIKKLSGVTDDDLIYVTFHNEFKQVPFYVVVDRVTHSVVVSIRGTLSFQDALADLSAVGASFDIAGVEHSYCHAAMLDCANYIKTELQVRRVLETAFSRLQEDARLVITGHSLGAGVAAILAVLLRPQYPELICFSFSPPGGLMSQSASKYTQEFVCSVVLGKDLVPRLGMHTLADLKVKLLRALCQCNEPKFKILATGCLRLVCCAGPSNDNSSNRSTVRDESWSRHVDEERIPVLQDSLRTAEMQLEHTFRSPWPMHPAGQILHIVEVSENPSLCSRNPVYGAIWSRPENFDKIIISHKMVSDHFPNAVHFALEQLCNRSYVPQFKQTVQQHC